VTLVRNDGLVGGSRRVGMERDDSARPISAPTICAPMNGSTELGAIPANESENIRPTVTAGFANDVELVNQYAAPM
jgi:hypothetical protein